MYMKRAIAEALLRRSVEVMAELRAVSGPPVSARIDALNKFLSASPFGCNNHSVVQLVEILTGEKLYVKSPSEHPRQCSIVTITSKATRHAQGTTALVVGASGGSFTLEEDGLSPADSCVASSSCQLATPEAEAAFREQMKNDDNLNKLAAYIGRYTKTDTFFAL